MSRRHSKTYPCRLARFIRSRNARQGSVYVAVLGVAMILAIIGVTALHTTRADISELAGVEQMARAEFLSQAAVELAMSRIQADASWRTNYVNAQETPNNGWTSIGGSGGLRFAIVDGDGNLADDGRDHATIRGIGQAGRTVSVTAVDVEPSENPLNSIEVSLHADGAITLLAGASTSTQILSSNSGVTVTAFISTFTGDVWTTGLVVGLVSGSVDALRTPPRQMPDDNSLFDYYLANGTAIDVDAISGRIERVVLSAANNPYGPENPQGIYIIDATTRQLTIADSRIQATLVVISPTYTVLIDNDIHWSPPAENFPAMLVRGSVEMKWDGDSNLRESTNSVNFNPAGTPYLSVADSDTTDSYPPMIRGLTYVTDNLSVTSDCTVRGVVVVGGAVTVSERLSLTYDAIHRDYPPPGFSTGSTMRIVPSTWRRTSR